MLVLSRKAGDRVTIGDNIVVEVVGFERYKVQLGFTAPFDVPILRDNAKTRGRGSEPQEQAHD